MPCSRFPPVGGAIAWERAACWRGSSPGGPPSPCLRAPAFSYPWLLAIRFLFGAGEAGAWPNVARTFSAWFPLGERGTAQGIFFMGAHLAGGLTPLLVTALLAHLPWRALFVIFGSIGFVW